MGNRYDVMELTEEVYKMNIDLKKELSEIRKLLIPISMYFAEKLKEVKE